MDAKFEYWTNELLDLGKRNKMIKYMTTKRGSLDLLNPNYLDLFNLISLNDKTLTFEKPIANDSDWKTASILSLLEMVKAPIDANVGDIKTSSTLIERDKTLKSMRSKSRLSLDEQGINILYLISGFIEWKEKPSDSEYLRSPLILTPVQILKKSITSHYELRKFDDDIVLNPTLAYLFEKDYDLVLPEFNKDELGLEEYMVEIEHLIARKGWRVIRESTLGLVSFLKINMYKDLLRNEDRVKSNPIIQSFVDESFENVVIPTALQDYNHDKDKSYETYQVVNADSSQEDAILLSREGISYVLQGPPGTGKSQTITNIISQGLADGKKILFVSEKQAALDVVYRKLEEANLEDFCLPLHNHNANKKHVLEALENNLYLDAEGISKADILSLTEVDIIKQNLTNYVAELHDSRSPAGRSIYQVIGENISYASLPTYPMDLDKFEDIDEFEVNEIVIKMKKFESNRTKVSSLWKVNPWEGFLPKNLSYDRRLALKKDLEDALELLDGSLRNVEGLEGLSLSNAEVYKQVLLDRDDFLSYPNKWHLYDRQYLNKKLEYLSDIEKTYGNRLEIYSSLEEKYYPAYFKLKAGEIIDRKLSLMTAASDLLYVEKDILESNKKHLNFILENKDQLERVEANMSLIVADMDGINSLLDKSLFNSINGLDDYYRLIDLLNNKPYISEKWFNVRSIDSQITYLEKLEDISSRRTKNEEEISKDYDLDVMDFDYKAYNHLYERLINKVNNKSVDWFDRNALGQMINKLENDIKDIEKSYEFIKTNQPDSLRYIVNPPSNLKDLTAYGDLMKFAHEGIKPSLFWLEEDGEFEKNIDGNKSLVAEYKKKEELILKDWSDDILTVDGRSMLNKFVNDYTSFTKIFKSGYKNDFGIFKNAYKGIESLDDNLIKEFLPSLIEFNKLEENLKDREDLVLSYFEKDYSLLSTDWDELLLARESLIEIKNKANLGENLLLVINKLMEEDASTLEKHLEQIKRLSFILENEDLVFEENIDIDYGLTELKDIEESVKSLRTFLSYLESKTKSYRLIDHEEIARLINLIQKNEDLSYELKKYKEYINFDLDGEDPIHIRESLDGLSTISKIEKISPIDDNLKKLLLEDKFSYPITIDTSELGFTNKYLKSRVKNTNYDLHLYLTNLKLINENISLLEEELNNLMGYSKERVNSLTIFDDLLELENLQNLDNKLDQIFEENRPIYGESFQGEETDWFALREILVSYLGARDNIDKLNIEITDYIDLDREESLETINKILVGKADMEEINKLFDEKEGLNEMGLKELSLRYENCHSSVDYVNDWINYIESKNEIRAYGLEEFLNFAEKGDYKEGSLGRIFLKSYYEKWLNNVIDDSSELARFNSIDREKTIREFIALDESQFELTKRKIRAQLIEDFPDYSSSGELANELAILRHELGKKSKIMPIRKLFSSIPNLLLTLKPCLMMSPLSVAYYLEAETYHFDMVIFDEASQIFPQDAIGAIFRGNQVIISGDSKQLPPTSFFNVTSDYDDYDAMDYDDIVYDSILEEASVSLPNRSLLWHYRSKNEELISFSNKHIYNNNLVTFPSNVINKKNEGVEYVYVADGVYENRCNEKEAEKIVSLVKDHFDNHPERSLGIVAFSEKQQNTIEDSIYRFRLGNREYEKYFDEELEEPFFVKNLENVQGDERDTIIFSIGYAKNKAGNMYMRFGPLSQVGGERRLNVAITRAKYNVKLVGSIQAKDIDLSRTESEGARLLKEYIEFAVKDETSLEQANQVNRPQDDLKDYLIKALSQKYELDKDVGNSDYKLDIAIKHPIEKNNYILGLELDGPFYAKARTSRDRDKIRLQALEAMGWNIYRIWSLEWFRNPKKEMEKLENYIDSMIEEIAPGFLEERKELLRSAKKSEDLIEDRKIDFEESKDEDNLERESIEELESEDKRDKLIKAEEAKKEVEIENIKVLKDSEKSFEIQDRKKKINKKDELDNKAEILDKNKNLDVEASRKKEKVENDFIKKENKKYKRTKKKDEIGLSYEDGLLHFKRSPEELEKIEVNELEIEKDSKVAEDNQAYYNFDQDKHKIEDFQSNLSNLAFNDYMREFDINEINNINVLKEKSENSVKKPKDSNDEEDKISSQFASKEKLKLSTDIVDYEEVSLDYLRDESLTLEERIIRLIQVEQPIDLSYMYKKLEENKDEIDHIIFNNLADRLYIYDDFIRFKDFTTIHARKLKSRGKRDFSTVYILELSSAMLSVLAEDKRIKRDELNFRASRIFGYNYLRSEDKKKMDQALDYLIRNEYVRLEDNFVEVVNG